MTTIERDWDFDDEFTKVPNAWLRDATLSPKAMWLLANLLSHRSGFQVSVDSLVSQSTANRAAIKTGLRELEDHGYLRREQAHGSDGFGASTYHLLRPSVDSPSAAPVSAGFVSAGNRPSHIGTEDQSKKTIFEKTTAPAALEGVEAPPSRAKAKHRMTEDFSLTPDMEAYARAKAPSISNVATCFEGFRNYWISQGTARADWVATWRNWVLKRQEAAERDGWKPPKVAPVEIPADDGLKPVLAW